MRTLLTSTLMTINLCKLTLAHRDQPTFPAELIRLAESTLQACAESENDVLLMAMAHKQLPCLQLMGAGKK
jgi:hypothetical protein